MTVHINPRVDRAAATTEIENRPWRAFALLVVAYFMTIVDLTIVNVSLPTIGTKLQFAESDLQWVVSAYGLTFGGFLLLGGRAADLLGRRRLHDETYARLVIEVEDPRATARLVQTAISNQSPGFPLQRLCETLHELARRSRSSTPPDYCHPRVGSTIGHDVSKHSSSG